MQTLRKVKTLDIYGDTADRGSTAFSLPRLLAVRRSVLRAQLVSSRRTVGPPNCLERNRWF